MGNLLRVGGGGPPVSFFSPIDFCAPAAAPRADGTPASASVLELTRLHAAGEALLVQLQSLGCAPGSLAANAMVRGHFVTSPLPEARSQWVAV